MNGSDLLKLNENLSKDKYTKISHKNLYRDYIVVSEKTGEDTLDICPICTCEYILEHKKNASDVVDILVHNYAQAIYVYRQNDVNEILPIMSVGIDLIYKFDENNMVISEDDCERVVIPESSETLGDMIRLTDMGIDFDSIPTSVYKKIYITPNQSLIKTKTLGNDCFVSFNELITELSSREIYTNYVDFQTVENSDCPILNYSPEAIPLVEKSNNQNL